MVRDLRGALGDDAHEPQYIRTAFGYGYAFVPEVTADGPRAADPQGALSSWRLVYAYREIALREGDNVLGRTGQDVVVLDSPTVSRHHAVVRVSGDRATIEDLGSKNGTWLGDDARDHRAGHAGGRPGAAPRVGAAASGAAPGPATRPRPRSWNDRPGRRHDGDAQSLTSPTAASAGASRLTSTLSMRRPSMSTTSKRIPLHSNVSAVRGMRPSRAITKPPSVW